MKRSPRGRPRPGSRKQLPIFEIVCDDTACAIAYWNAIGRLVSEVVTIRTHAKGGQDPGAIVAYARLIEVEAGDRVWVLLDREFEQHKQRAADAAAVEASGNGVVVLLSSPCFEVWLLGHFEALGRVLSDNRQVLREYERAYGKRFGTPAAERKSQTDFGKFGREDLHVATENAKRSQPKSWGVGVEERNGCWTSIWRLGEAILQLVGDSEEKK